MTAWKPSTKKINEHFSAEDLKTVNPFFVTSKKTIEVRVINQCYFGAIQLNASLVS